MKILRKTLFLLFSLILISLMSQLLTESTWFTSGLSYAFHSHNFHEIKAGKLFRSGELKKTELEKIISEHGIKTIIDLRKGGDRVEKNGYSERETISKLGGQYFSVPMVGSNTRQKEALKEILKISKITEGPTLIHCSSGTHRSGLASAVWLMVKEGEDPHSAANQLSPKFGYFKWERRLKGLFIGHPTSDQVMWHYLDDYSKTGIDFETWLNNHSDPIT